MGQTSSRIAFTLLGSQKEKREKGAENLLEEIIAENYPNLGNESDIQIQEVQGVPKKDESKDTKTHYN